MNPRKHFRALSFAGLALLAPCALGAQPASASSPDAASLAALERAGADTLRSAAHLLAPGTPTDGGAALRYWLRVVPRTLALDVVDARGRVVRRFAFADSGDTAGVRTLGHHALTWDLRHDGALALDGAPPHPGPLAVPGAYRVRLTVNGDTAKRSARSLVLPADPRTAMNATDRAEQFAFLSRALARSNEARDGVLRIRRIRAELAERETRIAGAHKVRWQLLSTVLRERLDRIERELHGARPGGSRDNSAVIDQLANVAAAVEKSGTRPGPIAYTGLTTASMELDKRMIELREELTGTLVRVNAVLEASQLESILP